MRQPSVMTHQFSQVPRAEIPRSSFDRSHGYKTTMDSGFLVPIFVDEALPGDTYNVRMTGFARLATPLTPFMDNAYFNTFFFAVPIRLVWDNWQRFNGEQDDPGDSTDYLIPQVSPGNGGWAHGSLADYMGLPPNAGNVSVSSLWFRAYNLIWNEWFRDQNLQDSVPVPRGDGPDDPDDFVLLRRGKRHDYFTSALPWPQKGPAVTIPIGGSAPVAISGSGAPVFSVERQATQPAPGVPYRENSSLTAWGPWDSLAQAGWTGTSQPVSEDRWTGATALWVNPGLSGVADLTAATATTINQLRQAFQIQRLYERDARGGTRYTEIIRSHFGVVSPDARLQRPEYLGGGQSAIMVQQVPQTSASETGGTPQGNLAAYGTSVLKGHGFTKSFTEHCLLIGLVSVRADLNYQQGVNRMFSRRTRFDFYWPALAHLGEQAILRKEIFATGNPDGDNTVFGYQERYAEYRYKPSLITGKLRSSDPQSLDIWHLAQDFESPPVLNASFIEDNPPFDRVIAVPSEPQFIADFYFRMRCARPMPVYGVPGLIDHF